MQNDSKNNSLPPDTQSIFVRVHILAHRKKYDLEKPKILVVIITF